MRAFFTPWPRRVTRPISILTLLAWAIVMALLVRRSYLQASTATLATDLARYRDSAAIDTETLGLNPHRDRLCLVQLSPGDGTADIVQIMPEQGQAPNLARLLGDAGLPHHAGRAARLIEMRGAARLRRSRSTLSLRPECQCIYHRSK